LSKREVRKIHEMIKEQWGAEIKLDFVFLQNTKGKIYIVNRAVFDFDPTKLRIDSMGMYFGKIEKDGLRLSIEGSQIVGPKAKKNVIEIQDKKLWLKASDIKAEVESDRIIIAKNNEDFMGCGRLLEDIFKPFIPKARRFN